MIPGEEDAREMEEAMWKIANSDTFVLTFRTQQPQALFFPDSILAEGRNMLLAAAWEEFQRGHRYTYYVVTCFSMQMPKFDRPGPTPLPSAQPS